MIENAQWADETHQFIVATVDGVVCTIPASAGNRHYDEIVRENISVAEAE